MAQMRGDRPTTAATRGEAPAIPPQLPAAGRKTEADGVAPRPLTDMFRLLAYPLLFSRPRRGATPQSYWHEHIPFAMLLVDLLRPRVLVELGTQYGVSYCAFCQAVHELGLATRCYAVDTWEGDAHTRTYAKDVLDDLRQHHDPLYGTFSTLLRCTFDQARGQFADGTIDLLHIDGYHTYAAVKHDFDTWLPKLSPSAVVLLHDTNVRKDDFGVYRLFEELKPRYRHFEFLHGSGLGVVAVGEVRSPELAAVLSANDAEGERFRALFAVLGRQWTPERARVVELETAIADLEGHIEYLQAKYAPLTYFRGLLGETLRAGVRAVKRRVGLGGPTDRPPR